jgi:hypothetical protein
MPKNHRKKQRVRARKTATGASYASAQAGTAHRHVGPPIDPVDGQGFGAERTVEMRIASALIGACLEKCRPCQRSLADKVLAGDRLVIASLAGSIYSVLPSVGFVASPPTRAFHTVARESARTGDGREVLALVEGLGAEELEELLEDTLDMWSAIGGGPLTADVVDGEEAAESSAVDQEEDEPRRVSTGSATAYLLSAGMDEFLSEDELLGLPRHAEATAAKGDPIVCYLCDQPIDVLTEPEVHVGLTTRTLAVDGKVLDTVQPVWTHPACGRFRIWPYPELMGERQRRGLYVAPEDRVPDRVPKQGPQNADYTFFSLADLPGGMHPLVVIQPGEPHEYGVQGHMADRLSDGFKAVDLTGRTAPPELESWQLRCEKGRMTAVTRLGGGAWYRQEGGYATPGNWRQAARKHRKALVLVVPAGTVTDEEGDAWLAALGRASQAGHVLGGLMTVRGTLS